MSDEKHHHHHDHDHDHHHDHDQNDDYDNEFDIYPQQFLPYFESSDFHGHILDVRETWEQEEAYIRGSVSIPLQQLFYKYSELDANETYYVLCTQGFRSSYASAFLLSQGFEKVFNIQTGINGIIEFLQERHRDEPKWLIRDGNQSAD